MIIDDEESVTKSLKGVIEPSGFKCITFQEPKAAINRFKKDRFDVVITDYKMENMNGIDVLKTIQKIKPGTPVIIVTGYADTHSAIQAVNYGAFAFLQKPIDIKEIFNILSSVKENMKKKTSEKERIVQFKEERENLIKEIHHRVKNNLQIIRSLLKLQIQYVDNSEAIQILNETYNRIYSMALVHENVYDRNRCEKIYFDVYIKKLVKEILKSNIQWSAQISLKFDIESIPLEINTAIPCGLIINELVNNAIHHAFPDNKKGTISIVCRYNADQIVELRVKDDGLGFHKEIDFNKIDSLGLELVKMLSEHQLDGKLSLDNRYGTEFIIQFQLKNDDSFKKSKPIKQVLDG